MRNADDDWYRGALADEAQSFAGAVRDADLTLPVPTCPEWTVADLAEHVGRAYRWAAAVVDRQATEFVPFDSVEDMVMPATAPAAADWVRAGAQLLLDAERSIGPDVPVWNWRQAGPATFWVGRMANETVVHRADAALALKLPFEVGSDLAADVIDEGLELACWAATAASRPQYAELRGSGELLHLHATDTQLAGESEWLIRRTPEGAELTREHARADVALRGRAVDLMLVLNRRVPLDDAGVEVLGDRSLIEHWLAHSAF